MKTGIKKIAAAITSFTLITLIVVTPQGSADTLEGTASVSNSSCSFISGDVDTSAVDPESYFLVSVRVRDNDTLSDIENVVVKVFANNSTAGAQDDRRSHYTFWFDPSDSTWHSTMTNIQGSSFIDTAGSQHPSDTSVNEDNYTFKILLNGTADPNVDWNLYVEVSDGGSSDSNGTYANVFSVNNYVHYDVRADGVEWTGLEPDTTDNPATNNPITIENIETNVNYNVQTKLSEPDWIADTTTDKIYCMNTTYSNSDPDGTSGLMKTEFNDVYTNKTFGEGLTKGVNYFLTVPADTDPAPYSNTFHIEVVPYQ